LNKTLRYDMILYDILRFKKTKKCNNQRRKTAH